MASAAVKPKEILELLHRQGFRCAYTGDPLTPESTGADHRIPVSRGGGHGIENIVLVTQAVNSAKGSMPLDDFIAMCRKVAALSDAPPAAPREGPPAEELAGAAEPVEILTRLGYPNAAEDVRVLRARVLSYERTDRKGGRKISLEDYTAEKRAEIATLRDEIARLRVTRSALRAQTGWKRGTE